MASFGNRTPSKGTSIPATLSGNIHISICSTGLRYKIYHVEVVFSPLGEPWVSDDHVPPKTIATELEGFEGQATTCESTMPDIALEGLQEKYSIPDEYVLLRPGLDARACSPPPGCDSVYKKHLKFGIYFSPYRGFEVLESPSWPSPSSICKTSCGFYNYLSGTRHPHSLKDLTCVKHVRQVLEKITPSNCASLVWIETIWSYMIQSP